VAELTAATGLKSGDTPVPASWTVCGLPAALLDRLSVADSAAETEGLKVITMEQLAPAVSVDPQFPETAKSLALGPLKDCAMALNVTLPELSRVTVCVFELTPTVWFPKEMLVVDKIAMGAVPVPESAMESC
jgi:hypothetical protein